MNNRTELKILFLSLRLYIIFFVIIYLSFENNSAIYVIYDLTKQIVEKLAKKIHIKPKIALKHICTTSAKQKKILIIIILFLLNKKEEKKIK